MKRYSKYWFIFAFALLLVKAIAPAVNMVLPPYILNFLYTMGYSSFLFTILFSGVERKVFYSWINSIKMIISYSAMYILLVIGLDVIIFLSINSSQGSHSVDQDVLTIVFFSLSFHLFLLVIVNTMIFMYHALIKKNEIKNSI